jgi:hypothetical protein
MIPTDDSLSPDDLALRRKAEKSLLIWPLVVVVVGMTVLGATTSFFDAVPTFVRGMIYLGVGGSLIFGIAITAVCLRSRLWRMTAINAGCVAAAITFLVVAGLGAFGSQFPRTVAEALRAAGF